MKKNEILLLLIVGLVPLLWYKSEYLGFGHDMGFPLAPVDHFLDRLYTWTDRLGPFGSNSVQVLPGMFIHGLEALLSFVGFSVLMVQKMTYIFWFVLPGITMYILLRYLHPKNDDYSVRISGSLFYMMNHYLLQAWTIAERTKFSIIAALPLVVLFVIKVFHQKEPPLKNSILIALTLFFLNGGEGIPLLISLFVVVAATTLTFFFLSDERFWLKTKRLFIFVFLSSLFWILLSSYWLYPYFKSYQQTFGQRYEAAWGIAGTLSWSQGVSVNTSWINLLKLRGIPDWYSSSNHPYANEFFKNPLLLSINFVIVALALTSLINLRNLFGLSYKTRICCLFLLVIGVPLSAGSHAPLGVVYDYLLANVPGFGMFRSGFFKFGMIIWFAYAYLIAVGIKDVIDWLKTKLTSRYISPVISGTFIISLFVYNYPFFTGSFFNYSKEKSTMVKVPGYVFEAKKELDSNKFSTRTLSLPNADIRTEYIDYDWGYFSLNDLSHMMGRKSLTVNGVLTRPNETSFIVNALSEYIKFGKSNLIKFMGVDRAIVQNDFISPDYEGNSLSGITESFRKSEDFIFKKSIGRWDFYDYNKEVVPQINSPMTATFISSDKNDLNIAANLPGALDNAAFIWSDSPKDGHKEEIFNKYIIQARCADCPPEEYYQIYFATSKILIPGTIYYKLGRFVNEARKNISGNPISRLEISLSTSTTLISDLGSLQAKKDEKGIQIAAYDLIKNLDEMRFNLSQIYDLNTKKAFHKKLRFFLSFFLNYESQWAKSAQPGPIKTSLLNLEAELVKLIDEIEISIGRVELEKDDKSYKYSLDVPKNGLYNLYVYQETSVSNKITVSIDNRLHGIQKFNSNWYKATGIYLDNSSILQTPKILGTSTRPIIFVELIDKNILTSPNIEFVALNQTKYLVKVKENGPYVLNFNSRFDNNWTLREVNTKLASKYFSGNKINYNGQGIVEYERKDKHLITDILFPGNKQKHKPSFELNGFSSGWIIRPQDQAGNDRIYLLEYNLQNSFYIALSVSLATFIFILSLYLLKYGKNK